MIIIAYSRGASAGGGGGPAPPSTNLKLHFDFSDISTLYKTFTFGNNPCYTNVATADADAIAVVRSKVPASPSDWVLQNNADATKSPILRLTTPLLQRQCLDFDGANDRIGLYDRLGSTQILDSDFFSAGAKTILISFRCESLPVSSGTYQPLFADASGGFFFGVYVYNNSGTQQILFQHADITFDSLFHGTIAVDTNYVVMARHESGNLYASINGGAESSPLASGDSFALNRPAFVGGGSDGSVFNGRIGEIAVYDAALTGTTLSDAITYFTAKWL